MLPQLYVAESIVRSRVLEARDAAVVREHYLSKALSRRERRRGDAR